MKRGVQNTILTCILITFAGMGACFAQGGQSATKTMGAEEKKKVSGKKPMVKVMHTSLYKNSHIITHRGEHAIIPKNSIIILPAHLKRRVTEKPDGEFILWPDFKHTNKDWIWTLELSLDQAKGITPISEKKIKDLEKLNRLVVALYRGNPVSVLPSKKKIAKK